MLNITLVLSKTKHLYNWIKIQLDHHIYTILTFFIISLSFFLIFKIFNFLRITYLCQLERVTQTSSGSTDSSVSTDTKTGTGLILPHWNNHIIYKPALVWTFYENNENIIVVQSNGTLKYMHKAVDITSATIILQHPVVRSYQTQFQSSGKSFKGPSPEWSYFRCS